MTGTILVVDDDPHIREVIAFALDKAGFATRMAGDGREALSAFSEAAPDLVVLDINMPELDGLDVCRSLRRTSDVPILFLSSREEEVDRIVGLEIGGDDYVSKPFSPRELVARIKAILKRTRAGPAEIGVEGKAIVRRGRVTLDPAGHEALVGDIPVTLTATEFAILLTLLERPQHVRDRPSLMVAAYGANMHVSDRTIDSHIRNIRQKLQDAGCPDAIQTVHGVGYKIGACT